LSLGETETQEPETSRLDHQAIEQPSSQVAGRYLVSIIRRSSHLHQPVTLATWLILLRNLDHSGDQATFIT
jgi:hypothetical protein